MGATDLIYLKWKSDGIDAARDLGIQSGANMSVYDVTTNKIKNIWNDGLDRGNFIGSTNDLSQNSNSSLGILLIGGALLIAMRNK